MVEAIRNPTGRFPRFFWLNSLFLQRRSDGKFCHRKDPFIALCWSRTYSLFPIEIGLYKDAVVRCILVL
jgi:hypothetical protein